MESNEVDVQTNNIILIVNSVRYAAEAYLHLDSCGSVALEIAALHSVYVK